MPTLEENELPLFKRYLETQHRLSNNSASSANTAVSANDAKLQRFNLQRLVPRFVSDSNKYYFYVLALLLFGLLGMVLKSTLDLDFSEVSHIKGSGGGGAAAGD